ncbi:hypothetical protein BpHYR1_027611 [Brachionus plicatilis]|uniref:Uncharacterized protein n=1 Tax=Brachionus plicatilis TaxID=10195 RepID=A0A3M7S4S6_BRAPC|nr:hypothetical protein BpHYR1_027611 [Brachionus plicatilis]
MLIFFLSENLVRKLQVIQNSAIRSILKLKFDMPSEIVHHEGWSQLSLNKIDHRLDELAERYENSVDMVVQLDLYKKVEMEELQKLKQPTIFDFYHNLDISRLSLWTNGSKSPAELAPVIHYFEKNYIGLVDPEDENCSRVVLKYLTSYWNLRKWST